MKLLFSLTYYYPHVSGLTIYVQRLAEMLARSNNKVTVLCMKHNPELPGTEINNRVRIIRAETLTRISKGFLSIDWISKSWREVQMTDKVVVNLPQVEGVFPAIFAKLRKKHLVAIYHSEIKMENRLIFNVVGWSNRLILLLADQVVSYTEDFAVNSEYLSKYLNKITYLYPIIPTPETDKELGRTIKQQIGKGKIVGMAARLSGEKGFEFLLEAVEKLNQKHPDLKLKVAIAGSTTVPGEEKYRQKILDLADKMPGRIIFLGQIDPEKMGSFYQAIDLLAVPSVNTTETFGIVQVEAMKMGVPVVTTNLPGVRVAIAKTGWGKIVNSKDPEALAEAIQAILKEDYRTKEGSARINSEFSQEKTETAFRSFFER